jgi:hypothetical protein
MIAGIILIAASCFTASLSGQTAPEKKAVRKSAAKKAAATGELTVPKDAVKLNDLEWRWKAKDGKVWIYRRTPFGLSRFPAEGSAQAPPVVAGLSAIDHGEEVEFSRRTPFGMATWRKKKTELDAGEKAALDEAIKLNGAKQ